MGILVTLAGGDAELEVERGAPEPGGTSWTGRPLLITIIIECSLEAWKGWVPGVGLVGVVEGMAGGGEGGGRGEAVGWEGRRGDEAGGEAEAGDGSHPRSRPRRPRLEGGHRRPAEAELQPHIHHMSLSGLAPWQGGHLLNRLGRRDRRRCCLQKSPACSHSQETARQ